MFVDISTAPARAQLAFGFQQRQSLHNQVTTIAELVLVPTLTGDRNFIGIYDKFMVERSCCSSEVRSVGGRFLLLRGTHGRSLSSVQPQLTTAVN